MKTFGIIKHFFVLAFILGFINAYATTLVGVDSVLRERIIKAGSVKLQHLIDQNEQYLKEGKKDKLSFVVSVNPEDYINDIAISGNPNYISSATVEGNYNARLNQIYQTNGIECYFILINCFDVKMTAEMPLTYPFDKIFSEGSFFDENSNIQALKSLHEVITTNILYSSNGTNRKRYVMSFANYCCSEFNNSTGGTGCFRLYTLNTVKPTSSAPVVYFDETFNYYKAYLRKDLSFVNETGRDLAVDKMITDFEKSVKNYGKKAIILQTNTTNDMMALLSFFSQEDRQLLSNEERKHILKVFCSNAITLTTEIEILSILNGVPRDSADVLLNDLVTVNVNGKRLLKHLFDKFQNDDYKSLVTRLVHLVGYSKNYQYNLPDVEASISSNQISPSWNKVYEWSDCSTNTMYLEENNTDECKRPSHWKHAEKRYSTITMSNLGTVEVNGLYKKVENTISNNSPYTVTLNPITPASLNPYDLVVLVDKSTIEGLNDITETSGGTMVVPAFFLVYAKDKAFNRDVFELTMAITSVIGPEEILASKVIAKVSGFKRLLKFVRKAEGIGIIASYIDKLSPALKAIHNRLVSAGIRFVEEANAVKYLTKTGEEIARIENGVITVTKAKGSIPPTSDYLDATYIINHMNKFQQEGGAFVIRKSDILNQNYTSLAPRKFVGLKSEMESVITRYNNAGQNTQILVDELDLGSSYFNIPNDEVYFVTVEPNKGFLFDMPTGNEGGAYVGYWVPGGYTKHGTAEAVITNSASYSHNNSMQLFTSFFGTSNVIKIK